MSRNAPRTPQAPRRRIHRQSHGTSILASLFAVFAFALSTSGSIFLSLLLWPSDATAATLRVGPGQAYATPCRAFAAAAAGDVIEIGASGGYNGVYGPVGAKPTRSWNSTNYFRDVVFVGSP